jgi:hypothetical protein
MFLGGLGLVGWGAQDFHEVGKFEGHTDIWNRSRIEKNTLICDAIYDETGLASTRAYAIDIFP